MALGLGDGPLLRPTVGPVFLFVSSKRVSSFRFGDKTANPGRSKSLWRAGRSQISEVQEHK